MSTPSADESVKFLTEKLKKREPFVFTKFGDGDLWWMSEKQVRIAGGEEFRAGIGQELRDAAKTLAGIQHAYFGDQLTCGSGPYLDPEQDGFVRCPETAYPEIEVLPPRWLHFECLLIHRLSPELVEFYRMLRAMWKDRTARLLMVGGPHLLGACRIFGAGITVDPSNAHRNWGTISESIHCWHQPDVLLLSAGRASKMIAATLAVKHPEMTIIELGSALDPLFVGRTRSEQVDPEKAREYFKEVMS